MILQKLKYISSNVFVRKVAVVASGSAGAQAIALVFTPVVTRLYGPEGYGILGVYLAIMHVLTPAAALSYPGAIVLPQSDSEALDLVRLSAIISIFSALVLALVIAIGGEFIRTITGLNEVGYWIWLMPFYLVCAGYVQILQQWLIRKERFGVSARCTITNALWINGGQAAGGVVYPVSWVLLLVNTIGQALFASAMAVGSGIVGSLKSQVERKSLSIVAKRHIDFALYRTPQSVINIASLSLPVMMLSALFSTTAAGYYALGRLVMAAPSMLLGKAVTDVFYPRIAKAANDQENILPLVSKAMLMLGLAGIIPYLTVIIFGPLLFEMAFGDEWVRAGEYARWIALWMFFAFINSPAVTVIPVLRMQKFHLGATCVTLLVRIFILLFIYLIFNDDLYAVAAFGVSGALINIGLGMIYLKECGKYDHLILRN